MALPLSEFQHVRFGPRSFSARFRAENVLLLLAVVHANKLQCVTLARCLSSAHFGAEKDPLPLATLQANKLHCVTLARCSFSAHFGAQKELLPLAAV